MKLEDLKIEDKELLQNVEKLIQSETDKVRTEYSKKIKELEAKVPNEMSDTEKALSDRLKAIEDREKELAKKELQTNASNLLKNKGLNTELSKYINLDGVEDLETYIGEIAQVVGNQAKQGKKFIPSPHQGSKGITKEDFKKMNYNEKVALYNADRELYESLSKN